MAQGFECPVCKEDTKLVVGTLDGCQHSFCFDCIHQWLMEHCSRCPMCNVDTTKLFKHTLVEPLSGYGRGVQAVHEALPPARETLSIEKKQPRADEGNADYMLREYDDVCAGVPHCCFLEHLILDSCNMSSLHRRIQLEF